MEETLVRVVAPHFTAGLIFKEKRCIDAAPILKWAIGKTSQEIVAYFRHKGWEWQVCP